jgi:RND family efflux transporter MFP subunit
VIVPRNAVNLASKGDGVLQRVKVHVGDKIKAREVTAVIDVGPARHQLALVQAALAQALSQQRKAYLEFNQASEHARRQDKAAGYMSEEELATGKFQKSLAGTSIAAARGRVAEEQARLTELKEAIANAELRAPFDGVVSDIFLQPGAVVGRGTTIVRVITADDLRVRFAIPADQRQSVAVGSRLRLDLGNGGDPLSAEVSSVSPEVDAASGLVVAEAQLTQGTVPAAAAGALVRVHLVRPLSAEQQKSH